MNNRTPEQLLKATKVLNIFPERLFKLLKQAYELGCTGWAELSDECAEKLLADFIKELSEITSNKVPVEPPAAKAKMPIRRSGPPSVPDYWDPIPNESLDS